jgi:hypothetical protein
VDGIRLVSLAETHLRDRDGGEVELGYSVAPAARVMRSIHLKQGRRIDAGLWSRLPSDAG